NGEIQAYPVTSPAGPSVPSPFSGLRRVSPGVNPRALTDRRTPFDADLSPAAPQPALAGFPCEPGGFSAGPRPGRGVSRTTRPGPNHAEPPTSILHATLRGRSAMGTSEPSGKGGAGGWRTAIHEAQRGGKRLHRAGRGGRSRP